MPIYLDNIILNEIYIYSYLAKGDEFLITASVLLSLSIFSNAFSKNETSKNRIKEHDTITNNKDTVVDQKELNLANAVEDNLNAQKSENINAVKADEKDNAEQIVQVQSKEPTEVISVGSQNLPTGEDGNMINFINDARVANGLNQLTYDPTIYSVADIRLNEISTYFSHTRPDGTEFYTVSSAVDGENLSKYGAGDARSSFDGFMNSKEHRENILYSGFTRVACKQTIIDGTVYWIQLFGY